MADALRSRFILDKVMQFFKIFMLASKILCINTSISKMLATYYEQAESTEMNENYMAHRQLK